MEKAYFVEWKERNDCGELEDVGTCWNKKIDAIQYYIEILKWPDRDISSLKILKGNRDITLQVNKFFAS